MVILPGLQPARVGGGIGEIRRDDPQHARLPSLAPPYCVTQAQALPVVPASVAHGSVRPSLKLVGREDVG